MVQSKWLKLGAASFLSVGVLAACAEEAPVEETPVEEEPVEEGTIEETPVEEEVSEEAPAEETPVTEEAPAEETSAAEEPVDLGAIDQTELETNYLDTLGWSPGEFDTHVFEEHNMHLADFANFEELESTVGPVENITIQ